MKTKKLILIVGLSLGSVAFSQQEAQFTQYMDNMLYYNPAYAGSREMMNITALHRQQWIGIDGAPMSQTLSFNTPLKYESVGIGASILNDKVGPINQTWFNVDMSYTLRFKKHNGKLSFGLKGGLNMLNANLNRLTTTIANDPTLGSNYRNKLLPNIGGGVYYHSKHWFLGVAVPRIVETKISSTTEITYLDQRHYYAMLGGYFNVNRMLKIRPSTMLKITENAPVAIDGSLAFIIYDRLWLGANYRLQESAGGMIQYQISPQFKIGYSCDISTSRLVKYNYGTHELLLSYDFLFKKRAITSPRYF